MNDPVTKAEPFQFGKNAATSASQATVDILEVLKRRAALILCCGALGLLLGVTYWSNAQVWYESNAKMLVTLKDVRSTDAQGTTSWSEDRLQASTLANHMEIVQSQNIIQKALERVHWQEMPFFQEMMEEDSEADPVKYVREHLTMTKGGTGTARDARSLNIKFRHVDPVAGLEILQAIVMEYEAFLDDQVNRTMSAANDLIRDAQNKVEAELKSVEDAYVAARRAAPILFSGEGSSNVYLDKFRRLQDELVSVEIERSSVATRLRKVEESLQQIEANQGDTLEMLALIDSASLERLGSFAGLQSGQTAGFVKDMPTRTAAVTAKLNTLTTLKAKLNELLSNFGPAHPQVEILRQEIALVEDVVRNAEKQTEFTSMFDELTPQKLLKAYTGFLRHDLAASDERRAELLSLASSAEMQSKQLIEFELRDRMMRAEIDRKQALFDGIVDQLRSLDTATGLSGYIHEVLDAPKEGEVVWPKLAICGAGGVFLGLMIGVSLAVMTDQLDNRFRSPAEIDSMLSLPVIGQVGRIRIVRNKESSGRMIVDAQAPEAEAFRLLRTYLLREVKSGNLRTAMVTSCQAKDGKSTIMANLGASFSELGIRTLIIDGDMRAPTQNRFFNLQINKGLSEVLRGEVQLDEAVQWTGLEGLSLLSAGGPVRNPAELLQSESFDKVIELVKEQYDLILVDSGPVLLVSDPAIVSQKCDIALLVVRAATDTKRKVAEAVRRLRAASTNLRGCIVNTFGSSKEFTRESGDSSGGYYYGYGYGYGYGNRAYGNRMRELSNGTPKSDSNNAQENGHHV
ncbi:polysaccharide biosynthesis tyrosine autokinase [Planctomicrobium sp. SH661]|uniref:polysaccharide biosynthesis tyrosine autokinase n=1 Tax=Planctomicrobium sp. SH661 TaxID=3448124 RepID=UPI003F5BDD11